MMHAWALWTDGNGATVKTMLFDYLKAFDFIDHRILIDKLEGLVMPRSVLNWIIDFLSDRSQRIKLAKGCYSEWGPVPFRGTTGYQIRPVVVYSFHQRFGHKFSIFMEICGRHHGLGANRKGKF